MWKQAWRNSSSTSSLPAVHERLEVGAHPGEFGEAHAALAEVDGLAGEVGRGCFAVDAGGVAVDAFEMQLVLHGADSGS